MADDVVLVPCWPEVQESLGEKVVAFWERESALSEPERLRRLSELVVVAVEGDEVVGVATATVKPVAQLRVPMWYFRCLVGADHRGKDLSTQLMLAARDHLEGWSKEHPEGAGLGLVMAMEASVFKDAKHRPHPVTPRTGLIFVGYDTHGNPVRVCWFDHARIPIQAVELSDV